MLSILELWFCRSFDKMLSGKVRLHSRTQQVVFEVAVPEQ